MSKRREGVNIDLLRNRVNLISITSSVEEVKVLSDYLESWKNSEKS